MPELTKDPKYIKRKTFLQLIITRLMQLRALFDAEFYFKMIDKMFEDFKQAQKDIKNFFEALELELKEIDDSIKTATERKEELERILAEEMDAALIASILDLERKIAQYEIDKLDKRLDALRAESFILKSRFDENTKNLKIGVKNFDNMDIEEKRQFQKCAIHTLHENTEIAIKLAENKIDTHYRQEEKHLRIKQKLAETPEERKQAEGEIKKLLEAEKVNKEKFEKKCEQLKERENEIEQEISVDAEQLSSHKFSNQIDFTDELNNFTIDPLSFISEQPEITPQENQYTKIAEEEKTRKALKIKLKHKTENIKAEIKNLGDKLGEITNCKLEKDNTYRMSPIKESEQMKLDIDISDEPKGAIEEKMLDLQKENENIKLMQDVMKKIPTVCLPAFNDRMDDLNEGADDFDLNDFMADLDSLETDCDTTVLDSMELCAKSALDMEKAKITNEIELLELDNKRKFTPPSPDDSPDSGPSTPSPKF